MINYRVRVLFTALFMVKQSHQDFKMRIAVRRGMTPRGGWRIAAMFDRAIALSVMALILSAGFHLLRSRLIGLVVIIVYPFGFFIPG